MRITDLTPEERMLVKKEMADRLKDLIYLHSEAHIKQLFETTYARTDFLPNDKVVINMKFEFVWNDINQIIGRKRREENETNTR